MNLIKLKKDEYQLRYTDSTGAEKKVKITGNKLQAENKARQIMAVEEMHKTMGLTTGEIVRLVKDKRTVKDTATEYCVYKGLSDKDNIYYYLNEFVSIVGPTTQWHEVTVDKLKEWSTRTDLKLTSLRLRLSTIRLFLNYVFRTGITDKDLGLFISIDKKKLPDEAFDGEELVAVSEEHYKAMRKWMSYDPALQVMLDLAWETGLRRADIIKFNIRDITPNNEVIVTMQKTKKKINVKITEELAEDLITISDRDGNCFPKFKKLHISAISNLIGRCVKELAKDYPGIEKVSLHSFRRAYVTRCVNLPVNKEAMLEYAYNLMQAQSKVGHSSPKTTQGYVK